MQVQQPGCLVVAGHLGQHLLDQLVLANRNAKGLTLVGIVHRFLEAGADETCRSAGNGIAPVVEARHGDFETLPFLSQSMAQGYWGIFKGDPARVTGPHSQLSMDGPRGHAWHLLLYDESRNATKTSSRVGLGEDKGMIRKCGEADPHLLAVKDIVVTIACRSGSKALNI